MPQSDETISVLRTRKKPSYPMSEQLRGYMVEYRRDLDLPVTYEDLLRWADTVPLLDAKGEDTLWQSVYYDAQTHQRLERDLIRVYQLLKAEGDMAAAANLSLDRIDFCAFGNSQPFRIRIVNTYNENQDYYYIKKADASRIYGLELEHLLSPNRMHFMTCGSTLVEEHIVGIPGDVFVRDWLKSSRFKGIRLAKELVKFNERCFIRLLGDMRSYNFVVELTADFEEMQVRIRPMDFDQQSYSGRMNFYRPQFFKENNPLVYYCVQRLNLNTAKQYQREEKALINRRVHTVAARLGRLLGTMKNDEIAPIDKVYALRESLTEHYKNKVFLKCESMGELVIASLQNLEAKSDGVLDPRLVG